MIKVDHIHGDEIYLISSASVARNPFFRKKADYSSFLEKVNKYLCPLCDILAYGMYHNEINLLIKLKDREEVKSFYLSKNKVKNLNIDFTPPVYKIFSQQVSNLFNSFVRSINIKYGRSGTMVARRYQKYLITDENELRRIIINLQKLRRSPIYNKKWRVRDRHKANKYRSLRSSKSIYKRQGLIMNISSKVSLTNFKINLATHFKILPPNQFDLVILERKRTEFFNYYQKWPGW